MIRFFLFNYISFLLYYLTFSAIVTAVVGFYTSTNAKTDAVEQTISTSKDSIQIKQSEDSTPTTPSK